MTQTIPTRLASTSDRDDPANYVSYDDYAGGASSVWSVQELCRRWNDAHPDAPVSPYGDYQVPPSAPRTDAFQTDCTTTSIFAAVQLVGGGFELVVASGALLAPEPTGATKVIGVITLLHGLDTVQSSIRTLVSCDRTATFTQQGASALASAAHASPQTAQTIGVVTDVGIGVGGCLATGLLSRAGPGAAQLVHLTSTEGAAAIRASQTLGLGRSTVYAGPEALAQARGWSILARTGLNPRSASEVILLPSQANQSFLVVQPLGPMSLWQRINGTVFSAGAGSFNLQTGVFTRTGAAVNQLGVYGLDSAVMATMRVAPGLADSPRTP